MDAQSTGRKPRHRPRLQHLTVEQAGAAIVSAFALLAIMATTALKGVLLPLAALLVALGFAVAAIAWFSDAHRSSTAFTIWDTSGALVFLGFTSALLSS